MGEQCGFTCTVSKVGTMGRRLVPCARPRLRTVIDPPAPLPEPK